MRQKGDWTGPFRRQFTEKENIALDAADEYQMHMNVLFYMRSRGEEYVRTNYGREYSDYIDHLCTLDLNDPDAFQGEQKIEGEKFKPFAKDLPPGVQLL